ncbi:MAG: outer membrane protein assembly factor [Xanthomonadales bacterium]|nr:outer membrane protein assembly factor [Xanthomonadales bacterium]
MPFVPAGRRRQRERRDHAPTPRTPMASAMGAGVLMLASLWATPAAALKLGSTDVAGIGGEARTNVMSRLSLSHHPAEQELTEARLAYLLRRAPGEVLTALEPFGFYDAQVEIESPRDGDTVNVRILVRPGRPVQVNQRDIVVEGPAADDKVVQGDVKAFRPGPREILDHRTYEASKAALERRLNGRGYFDAEPLRHRITVERASYNADIDVAWQSGQRYNFGETRFSGSQVHDDLLQPRIPYREGQPYSQQDLAELHRSLVDLDYFGFIDIQPLTDEKADGQVPIAVSLTPAKRSRYTAGIGYGTDSGPSIRAGLERRYVNASGHKFATQLALGARDSSLGAQYRIPTTSPGWPGWWSISPSIRRQQFGDVDSEIFEMVGARNGRWREYDLSLEAHLRRERYGEEQTTLIYPLARIGHTEADQPLYPTHGYAWDVSLAHGDPAFGSDLRFTQLFAEGRYIHGLGDRRRLLLRGQLGHTLVDNNERFPPSMRFYAGGDRSVRGYGYQEIGPYFEDTNLGGLKLAVASVEVEQMFNDRWGVAAFVDAGDAWSSDRPDPRLGAGLGMRWRSPVGPVRLDIGVGLDDPEHRFQLHLNIGPDFTP